jgi:hypothetical protein
LEIQVNANTAIAVCGVVIAVAPWDVSAYVAWATRKHNRLSAAARRADDYLPVGATAGLRLSNSGLSPAKITCSQLTYRGKQVGEFSKPHVDKLQEGLDLRPHTATLGGHPFLDTDCQQFLLSVDSYDPSQHGKFRKVIEERLRLEIQYESIYGGEVFTVVYPRHG